MMYLTQMMVDCEAMSRLCIRDAYEWHQRIWECFPNRDGQRRDFLTRFDDKGDHVRLLILSHTEPTRPDWCSPKMWQGPKQIGDGFLGHRHYRFELRANATKKVRVGNRADGTRRKQGRRVSLRAREDLIAWLEAKAQAGGFSIDPDTVRIMPRGRSSFAGKKGRRGVHDGVDFHGVLTVTDRDKFRDTFSTGIGSAKAFGFGMLMIQPLRGGR